MFWGSPHVNESEGNDLKRCSLISHLLYLCCSRSVRQFPERQWGFLVHPSSHKNFVHQKKKRKAASSSQRCTLKPTSGPLMAWKKALIWVSLFLPFCISIFSKNAASESHPRVFFFFFIPAFYSLSHIIFYTNLHRSYIVWFFFFLSRRCRSSSSSSRFLKLSFKLLHADAEQLISQPEW